MKDQELAETGVTRRDALRVGAGAAGGVALAGGLLGRALDAMAAPAEIGESPYGPLQAPDENGIRLPAGFKSRVIARSEQNIGPRPYKFHVLPDGMGSYKTDDGGFILVSNSEAPDLPALDWNIGTAAIRFDKKFNVTDAYPILKGTNINCAGGVTPWGTWLSCEEVDKGFVHECDPWGKKAQIVRPEMGCFKHEACAVDPIGKHVFLTEDVGDGCLYRFTPNKYPDLSKGRLDVAVVQEDGSVKWVTLPDPQFTGAVPTRKQVPEATVFRRGEGMWYDDGIVYFSTTQDDRVFAYHCADNLLEVLYDGEALGDDAPLHDTDNVTVSPISGDLFVCEDPGEHQICIITAEGKAASFLHLPGEEHANSELTGPVFDPSGSRLYFSSQRAIPAGVIYEISGPFRRTRAEPPAPKDKKKPTLKVRTLGKPSLRRLLRAGQPFRLDITDESMPVKVETKLVARMKRAGGKGSREVTIGRLNTKVRKSGKKQIRMKVGDRFRKRLRRRNVTRAKLIVIATDAKGNRRKVVKPVSFR